MSRMIRNLAIAIFALAFTASAIADTGWEYKVVYLPAIIVQGTAKVRSDIVNWGPDGVMVDGLKTKIMNQLADEGWDILAVIGEVGSDHAVYLRRAKPIGTAPAD